MSVQVNRFASDRSISLLIHRYLIRDIGEYTSKRSWWSLDTRHLLACHATILLKDCVTSQNSGRRRPWVHWDTDRETDIDRCASMFTMTGNQNFNASQHFLMNATTSRGTEWYFEKRGSCLDIGAFFMSLGVSKSRFRPIYASQSLHFFCRLFSVSDLLFLSVRLVFRSRIFSELKGI